MLSQVRVVQFQLVPRLLHFSVPLEAEPIKRKTGLDQSIEIGRIKRKVKRIEREIQKISRRGRTLKPVDEIESDRMLLRERTDRIRDPVTLSESESEERALLYKEWTRHKKNENLVEWDKINRMTAAQTRALIELRKSSEELYQSAIELDDLLLPFASVGPYHTPPNPNYESPDGEYNNTTKTFEYKFEVDRKFLANPSKQKRG